MSKRTKKEKVKKSNNHDSYKVYNNVQYNFFNNKSNFAALFNHLFHLEISPDDLVDVDSRECALYIDEDSISEDDVQRSLAKISKELFRDLIKQVNMKSDGSSVYMCIENQVKNERDIMGRINLYNALTYYRNGIIYKGKRTPVITALVGWGEYTFPSRYCFDDFNNEFLKTYGLRKYVPHYEVPVLNMKSISEKKLNGFPLDFKMAVKIIKVSTGMIKGKKRKKCMEEIREMMQNDSVGIEAKDLGAVYLSMGRNKGYMKDGFYDYYQEVAAEKKAEGKAEGRAEGEVNGRVNSLKNLMKSMNWSFDTAANALCIPQNERDSFKSLIC